MKTLNELAKKEETLTASSCCSTEKQKTCCEPEAKATCCAKVAEDDAPAARTTCGCQ
jgi:hypothetical protein